jgi:hypothetical protein
MNFCVMVEEAAPGLTKSSLSGFGVAEHLAPKATGLASPAAAEAATLFGGRKQIANAIASCLRGLSQGEWSDGVLNNVFSGTPHLCPLIGQ